MVTTWMDDCLRTGNPSLGWLICRVSCILTIHQGQLSLPSHRDRNRVGLPASLAGVKARRVHLCRELGNPICGDPIWQVTLVRIFVMGFPRRVKPLMSGVGGDDVGGIRAYRSHAVVSHGAW